MYTYIYIYVCVCVCVCVCDLTSDFQAKKNLKIKIQKKILWPLSVNGARRLTARSACHAPHVVRSNKVVRRLPTESNGTPAMELAFSDIYIHRYTNKRETEQYTRP